MRGTNKDEGTLSPYIPCSCCPLGCCSIIVSLLFLLTPRDLWERKRRKAGPSPSQDEVKASSMSLCPPLFLKKNIFAFASTDHFNVLGNMALKMGLSYELSPSLF